MAEPHADDNGPTRPMCSSSIRAQKEHLARRSDHGLCLECPRGSGSRVGAGPGASRLTSSGMEHGSKRNAWQDEDQERQQYANQVGADGWMLLAAIETPTTPDWMKTLPAVTTLRLIWEHQFEPLEEARALAARASPV